MKFRKYEESPLDEKHNRTEARKRKLNMKEREGSKKDRQQERDVDRKDKRR